ncbi:hypothetical protein DH2020_009952 [Rehmannia glutinosa]|uniref:Low-temperature-induced 65 kDa protein n=1 Tax=Rehmannia glutinosa TaxID=99300 RepID=A0ABR0X9X2_REHGL
MEAQLQRPTHGHHHYEEDPHDINAGLQSVIGGEGGDQHGEKKSVLKKVKDKAKKIKDTITKHGHGHEHDYRHDQISEEDDEEEDEDMVNAPEVHVYDYPAVIPGTNLPIQTHVNLEKPTDTREDRYNPNVKNEVYPNVVDEGVIRPSGPGNIEPQLGTASVETRKPETKNLPWSSPGAIEVKDVNVAEPTVKISPLVGLEEDPHSTKNRPASNYQAKVTDPTGEGAKEAEVAPILQQLDNLHLSEERSYTGSHDQFAPQPTPTKDQFNPESNPVSRSSDPDSPKSLNPAEPGSMPRDTIAGKISSATSAIADKVVSAKNVVASKMGYGGDSSNKPVSEQATEYGHKMYEKMAGAGSALMSKVQRSGDQVEHEAGGDTAVKGTDKGVSMKEYLAEKFRPGEEDKALSEVISERFHRKNEGVRRTEEEVKPMESEDAAPPRLATGERIKREGKGAGAGGVVNRVKGAVGSWLGKSTTAGSTPSGGAGHSKEEVGIGSQRPMLQESGN